MGTARMGSAYTVEPDQIIDLSVSLFMQTVIIQPVQIFRQIVKYYYKKREIRSRVFYCYCMPNCQYSPSVMDISNIKGKAKAMPNCILYTNNCEKKNVWS